MTDFSVGTRNEVESYWKEQLEIYTANETVNQEVEFVNQPKDKSRFVFFSIIYLYVFPRPSNWGAILIYKIKLTSLLVLHVAPQTSFHSHNAIINLL